MYTHSINFDIHDNLVYMTTKDVVEKLQGISIKDKAIRCINDGNIVKVCVDDFTYPKKYADFISALSNLVR